MINWERVKELQEDIGPDDIDDVIRLFLDEVQEVVDRLSGSRVNETLEQDMHFLKGSALNLGFDALGNLCSAAEKLAAQGKAAQVDVPKIIDSFAASRSVFLDRMQPA